MDEDECKSASDVEVDSDNDDQDAERELGNWLGQFDTLKLVSLNIFVFYFTASILRQIIVYMNFLSGQQMNVFVSCNIFQQDWTNSCLVWELISVRRMAF